MALSSGQKQRQGRQNTHGVLKFYIESFNARLRDELFNGEIFYVLRGAQIVIAVTTTRSGRMPRSDTNHQQRRSLCQHSPRGRLRYVGRLRLPRGASASSELTFHLDHPIWPAQLRVPIRKGHTMQFAVPKNPAADVFVLELPKAPIRFRPRKRDWRVPR